MSPSELWCSVVVPWRLISAISFWEVSMEQMLGSAVGANPTPNAIHPLLLLP